MAATITRQVSETLRLFPAELSSIEPGPLEMDLYIDSGNRKEYTLYCGRGSDFTNELRRRLIRNNHKFVYVPLTQHQAYRKVLSRRLDSVFRDPGKQRAERTRVVRECCAKMIEDVMLFPERPESVELVADISRQFAEWAKDESSEFSYLLDMAAHDYCTAMHMVNVGTGCGLLARHLKPEDSQYHAMVIQGGLLHDIGKCNVPETLLNKEGKLDPQEWQTIRGHPGAGFDFIKNHPNVPEIVLDMVRLHHERVDGTGYPAGLANGQICQAARLCTVVDVFDAVCSARPYRGPKSPSEALEIMRPGRGKHFDAEVFDAWSQVVARLVKDDPRRAETPPVSATGDSSTGKMSLDDLLPTGTDDFIQSVAKADAPMRGSNRRRHARYACHLIAKARVIQSNSNHPAKSGVWLEVFVKDISQGGLQIITAWPIECDEVLEIDIPAKDRAPVRRSARVAHVRPARQDEWCAGLEFLQTLE